jgi:cytochrome c
MKKTIIILVSCVLAIACGNSNDSKNQTQKDSAATSPDSSSAPSTSVADEKGLELIGASDCTTCHKLREKNIGPAYSDVAEKYRNTPHAADTLVQKVIKGGSGHWGAIPMTAHPMLAVADVKVMVNYILSLKK